MKKILNTVILALVSICSFSQDNVNANSKIEMKLESRNEIISNSEMVSFIDFYFINNKFEGNWMRMRKGNWFHFFQYPHDISEPTSWEEWYKFYIVEGSFNCILIKNNVDIPINGNYRIKIGVLK